MKRITLVRDELPNECVRVLLFSMSLNYWTIAERIGKQWDNDNFHRPMPIEDGLFTHWMPLPDPPEVKP